MTVEETSGLNKRLLSQVVNQLVAHPETHNQSSWHCGTSHCVGGWSQVFAHGTEVHKYPEDSHTDATALLGLSLADAVWLFDSRRTISEIHNFATMRIADTDRDVYGRDACGYDRDGYDRSGRDRDGYGRYVYGYGYDKDGYDRSGHDRSGHDRDGRALPLIDVVDESGPHK